MKILVRRWMDDDPNDTITIATDRYTDGPIANDWRLEASRKGADNGMVITFSKAENLYSHNTSLSAKEINVVLKLDKVTVLEEDYTVLINI